LLEVDRGRAFCEVGRELRVNRRSVHRWLKRYTVAHGSIERC
jgi:hypothetical protein